MSFSLKTCSFTDALVLLYLCSPDREGAFEKLFVRGSLNLFLVQVWFSNRRAKMRKQESSSKDDDTISNTETRTIRQPVHSTIIPPSNLGFMHSAYAGQTGVDSEVTSYANQELKPHLTELRPIGESTYGNIQSIFIPATQQNGYEMMSSNSSFLTPSPQPNPVFTIGMPPSSPAKMLENEDAIVNIKTETPPDTPASEATNMTFSSKSDSFKVDILIDDDLVSIDDKNKTVMIIQEEVINGFASDFVRIKTALEC